MAHVLEGQCVINGVDVWTEWHAFLREERKGSHENINSLLAPSKMKEHVSVNFREQDGETYHQRLRMQSEARDIVLHFCIVADSAEEFVSRYVGFIRFLKEGNDGWLDVSFPRMGVALRVFALEFPSGFTSVSNLWAKGRQGGAFKVKFREPEPLV